MIAHRKLGLFVLKQKKRAFFFSVLAGLFLSFVFNMYINPLVQTFFGGSVTFECFRRVV